jgi:hypothetical protein
MCEIFYLSDPTGLKRPMLQAFFKEVVLPASSSNPHGFGYFTPATLVKGGRAIQASDAQKFVARSEGRSFVVVHLRVSTGSAQTTLNAHPFRIGDWVLVHNGMFSNGGNGKHTDSFLFLKAVAKGSETDVVARVQRALDKAPGWASIFLFNAKSKRLYYFRTGSADFTFAKMGGIVMGATRRSRIEGFGAKAAEFFGDEKIYGQPHEDAFYEVGFASGAFTQLGKVKHGYLVSQNWLDWDGDSYAPANGKTSYYGTRWGTAGGGRPTEADSALKGYMESKASRNYKKLLAAHRANQAGCYGEGGGD